MQVIVEWSDQENQALKITRNVCFEDVENCLLNDEIIDALSHRNTEKYPNQKTFALKLSGYIYYVPFVEHEKKIFLKNIITSRKLNATY